MLSRSCVRRCAANSSVAKPAEFTNAPMVSHSRSGHKYHVSTSGADVGARNESAFVGYERKAPANISQRLALPHALNLITIIPIVMGLAAVGSVAWGSVMWGLYSRKHFAVARIERPANL